MGLRLAVTRTTGTHHAEGNTMVWCDELIGVLQRAEVKDGHLRDRYGTALYGVLPLRLATSESEVAQSRRLRIPPS